MIIDVIHVIDRAEKNPVHQEQTNYESRIEEDEAKEKVGHRCLRYLLSSCTKMEQYKSAAAPKSNKNVTMVVSLIRGRHVLQQG